MNPDEAFGPAILAASPAPLPPVPEGEQAPSLEFIIPVDFNIR